MKKDLSKLMTADGVIAALAIDQRGALKKMLGKYGPVNDEMLIDFKKLVAQELTPYASAILLDPEYGLSAAKLCDSQAGLLLAYEQSGYDTTKQARLPDLLVDQSVKRLKEADADACKFLLYYDVDGPCGINEQKKAFVERVGSECVAEGLPFFLELLAYDTNGMDVSSREFAKEKPHKVIEMMKEFSKERYNVDVLKVEIPVNMEYVAGFGDETVYSSAQAAKYFEKQSQATNLPFIFLSAGVSAQRFQETLRFAKNAGSAFAGVLCGRATWAGAVPEFMLKGEATARQWLQTKGKQNIEELNALLAK